jgi:Xaa-Pro aminopeptidase
MNEFEIKQKRINNLLEKHKLDGLFMHRMSSFAWATCGVSSYINTASSYGEASILLLPPKKYIVTNNIEAARLKEEERLNEKGWEFLITQWHEKVNLVGKLIEGKRIGSDSFLDGYGDLSFELARIRARLTTEEGQRFRTLGRWCAEAMNVVVHNLHPSQTEHEIAGILAKEVEGRGVQVIVNLIATDERVFSFRHPHPTTRKLHRYAMLIFHGGMVNQQTLVFGSIADVRAEITFNLEVLGKDAGYILAPCYNIQPISPLENIVAMYEAGYVYGQVE